MPPIAAPATATPAGTGAPAANPPTAEATASAAPAALYPWLPAGDTTLDGRLDVDTFARPMAEVVPVSPVPGGPPWRFDTGDPDPSTHPLIGFQNGILLVVLHGPVVVDGTEWYLLAPAAVAVDVPTGWSPATAPGGAEWIVPASLVCPPSPVLAERLAPLLLTDGLPVCYGDEEIAIEGELTCEAQPDTSATGPLWLEGGTCRFDVPPVVYGLDADLPPGRYVVLGHFDDPQVRDCRPADGDGSDEARLQAVLHCRRAFVATSVRPAG
jgi:hypothetical protein